MKSRLHNASAVARPVSIRDEDILSAAREVLLERGLAATAAHVAERAGISEASVFHRFKTKEQLFHAAIELESPPAWIVALPERVGRGDVAEQIAEIAHESIEFFRLLIPMVMLHWSSGPDKSRQGEPGEHPAIRNMKVLASYFEAEMRAGRLARHDPEVVARVFSGAVWNYVSMELMFDSASRLPMPEATFVRSLTKLLMNGLVAAPAASSLPPKAPKKR